MKHTPSTLDEGVRFLLLLTGMSDEDARAALLAQLREAAVKAKLPVK